jgi:alkaline phosphatase D
MKNLSRREFLRVAASIGAVAAFARSGAAQSLGKSKVNWTERRDRYPEGVASGDPQSDSAIPSPGVLRTPTFPTRGEVSS